jgi:hypothetical protein
MCVVSLKRVRQTYVEHQQRHGDAEDAVTQRVQAGFWVQGAFSR